MAGHAEQDSRVPWHQLAEREVVRKGYDQVADIVPQADAMSPEDAMAQVEPEGQDAKE